MKPRLTVLAAALLMTVAGCSSAPETSQDPVNPPAVTTELVDLLAAHSLDGMDGVQIVDHLDRVRVADRSTELFASVRAHELLLSDGAQEIAVPLDDASFYLSVAPYVSQTHDCYYHSLTTCQGELANQDIGVLIKDETGAVLVDQQVTTFDNGFAGFWLPRDVSGTIEITYDGLTARSAFSAIDEGATCVTTLKLEA